MKKNRLFHLAFLLVAVLLAQDSRAQTTLKGHTGRVESMKTSALTSEAANSDSVALVALYNATNGPSWRNKTNWLSNQPLGEWEGVSTENVGHVYELRLERNRLSGEIPSELGNLAHLRYLVLNQNRLSGEIPSELGNLASLRYLELDQNRLSGEIPAELGNLTNLERLVLSDNQLTGTIPKELSNLTHLTHLELDDNQLSTLPDSLFAGLSSLAVLRLDGNSVDPLPLAVSLEQVGADQVKAVAPTGAPFEIVLPISVTNGGLSGGATTLTIPVGSVESAPLTVVRTPGTTAAVTADIGTLPGLPTDHAGYALAKASDRPLEVLSSTVGTVGDSGDQQPEQPQQPEVPGGEGDTPTTLCDRTPQVRDAIVAAVPRVSDCNDVTQTQLATGITSLFLNGQSITTLKADDFAGLTSLVELRLYDNQLSTLPADLFDGLSSLTTLYLNGNQLSLLPNGLFDGLSSLATLYLYGNSVDPLPLTLSLEQVGADQVKAVAPIGAPFEIVLPISVTNGRLSGGATTLTIPAGSVASASLTVVSTPGTTAAVTVDIGTLPRLPTNHVGYALVKANDLPLEVISTLANTAPVFTDGASTTRTITENTTAGVNIGTAIAATDADHDVLTYTLGGTDAAAFAIEPTTGQLQTKAALDYETKSAYSVVVTVSDGTLTDTITVTITVSDSNESPTVETVGDSGDQQPEQPQQPEVPGGEGGAPTLIATTAAPLTELTVDGGVVALLLTGGTYTRDLSAIQAAVTVAGFAEITVNHSETNRVGDTVVTVKLGFSGDLAADGTLTFIVGAGAIANYDGPALTAEIPVTALAESVVAYPSELWESSLNGSVVTLTLTSRPYQQDLSAIQAAVTVSGIPGVTVDRSETNRVGDTVVTVKLGFSGDLAADGTLTFIVGAGAIANYDGPALTAEIPVTAVTESVVAYPSQLWESWLNGRVVTLTLTNRSYQQDLSAIQYAVTVSGILGVTFDSSSDIRRVSDTKVTVRLTYIGDLVGGMATDGTLIFTVQAQAIANYDGPALTVEIPVTTGLAPNNDFDTLQAAGNNLPRDLWSDGTTLWVADWEDAKLYAYNLWTKARDPDNDFNTLQAAENNTPTGLWSDGTTMWVVDYSDEKIYAYNLSTKARDPNNDFNTLIAAGNNSPLGLWSDGTTMWVVDREDGKIYAYNLSTKARDPNNDFNTLQAAGNDSPTGLWSDGTTLWVTDWEDEKIYAYNLSPKARDPNNDFNTLIAAGNNSPLGLWSDGTTMWVVDREDGKIYAYTRGAPLIYPSVPYARDPNNDFNGNNLPRDLWSDGTTLWVADRTDDKIYAYNLSTKAPDPDNDFNTLRAAGNRYLSGLWSDGTTLWVTDWEDAKLYAYNLSTKARDPNNDFNTLIAAGNNSPYGLWSDGSTLWVTDKTDDKLYAYNLSTKARDPNNDFNTLIAAGNRNPDGLWSDGTTLWVTDKTDDKLYAYNLSTKARDPNNDFNTLIAAGNDSPTGLWSDGTTMWVMDPDDKKIYAYFMPAKPAAKAQALIGLPEKTQLQQNAPNPFNSETVLSYFLLEPGPARLEVFSMIGQRVAVLRQGPQQAGYHRLRWNGRDDAGRPLASGIYLYRLVTDEGILTRKLVLLR